MFRKLIAVVLIVAVVGCQAKRHAPPPASMRQCVDAAREDVLSRLPASARVVSTKLVKDGYDVSVKVDVEASGSQTFMVGMEYDGERWSAKR